MEAARLEREHEYIDEQIEWWQAEGIPAYEAHIAVYGRCPAVVTWPYLRNRMYRDFAEGQLQDAYMELVE